ncbi:mannose-6-phosphate isomerase, class I [Streptomyces sp. DSM 42041]|uniref:mannose-6-phosphate isomerase n=1 Tax=Streptomyces hazeniae TaxID=3075538 RepID=A0ABU2P381_9ACTN|nr:mannose-6-phosphate isomerase, class I [Streptomyces sp. DSM 42041]MDT0382353.1 mannose-6-phosphate isomerase, class I [Streptomyces sp. DSM 42041]
MDRLQNTVRPYAWGSPTALPELLGEHPTGAPQAELWMGAHPGAPSLVDRGSGPVPLSEVIAADPDGELGAAAVAAFGPRLPFLLKLLAAAQPLSLQVHPDPAQAVAGFADEEARGVPRDAPHRNYKDDQHKPELLAALTPFEGLCGFRPAAEAARLLASLDVDGLKPYADILRARPEEAALREVLTAVLSADRDEIADTVRRAATAASRLAGEPGPHADDYAAYAGIARHHPGDPGLLAAMLLHFVRLRPGEALYLDAGVPHAYLSGLGVEIMASSDNVLRCGLTSKHVDVPELLRVVRFEATGPGVLVPEPDADGAEVYRTPVGEFRLSRHVLAAGGAPRSLDAPTAQIVLCTDGEVTLVDEAGQQAPAGGNPSGTIGEPGGELRLARGRSAYLPASACPRVSGEGTIFRATVAV